MAGLGTRPACLLGPRRLRVRRPAASLLTACAARARRVSSASGRARGPTRWALILTVAFAPCSRSRFPAATTSPSTRSRDHLQPHPPAGGIQGRGGVGLTGKAPCCLWAWPAVGCGRAWALFPHAQADAGTSPPTRPRSCWASAASSWRLMLFYANPFATHEAGPPAERGRTRPACCAFPTMMIHPPVLYSGLHAVHDPRWRSAWGALLGAQGSTPIGFKKRSARFAFAALACSLGVGILPGRPLVLCGARAGADTGGLGTRSRTRR